MHDALPMGGKNEAVMDLFATISTNGKSHGRMVVLLCSGFEYS